MRLFFVIICMISIAHVSAQVDFSCKGFTVDSAELKKAYIPNGRSSGSCNMTSTYIIPVVVHVIHNGQAEGVLPNISNAAIEDQIQLINEHFAKVGVPSNLYPGIAAATDIEFVLARSDENGVPHSGITRTYVSGIGPYDADTYIENTIKPNTIWNPEKYLNIWSVEFTRGGSSNILGYATFPDGSGLSGSWRWQALLGSNLTDGVVVQPYVFNPSDITVRTTLTHEIGHYLGLFHTFGMGSVGDVFNCVNGDECGDTPSTEGNGNVANCSASHTSCFSRDMVENFMDYSITCHQIFTEDQKDRMQQTLLTALRRPTQVSSPSSFDTYEPNSLSNAATIFPSLSTATIDSTITSYCSHFQDYDWYKIAIIGSGTLTIRLSSNYNNYDLELYGPGMLSQWLDGSYDLGSSNEEIVINITNPSLQEVYITVYSQYGQFSLCDAYQLQVLWQPSTTPTCVPLNVNLSTTNVSTIGATDGAVSASVTAGTPPYTYLWSNGANSSNISNLAVGSYMVTVNGADNCSTTKSAYVNVQGQQPPHCSGLSTLTASSGSFSDGSGNNYYSNNANCTWLIQPTQNITNITLRFSSFNTKSGDVVNVYDGANTQAPLIDSYSGNNLPPSITSTGKSLFVEFVSNQSDTAFGWNANYYSNITNNGTTIKQYEYWFDDDYSNKITKSISPVKTFNLATNLSTSGLPSGLHTLHIRFRDDAGNWSSVISRYFHKIPESNTTSKKLVEYQYWFDNDYANNVATSFTHIQAFNLSTDLNSSMLLSGLHTVHVRFRDNSGSWSSIISQYIHKLPNSTGVPNLVTGYRYWFDLDTANISNISLANPQNPYTLNVAIDASALTAAQHTFHIQFIDTSQTWSSIVTDTFLKLPAVSANFYSNDTSVCLGDTVRFVNTSVDADIYSWSFGDGNASSAQHPSHLYNQPGQYTITLIAHNSITGARDTLIKQHYVKVNKPVMNVAPVQNFIVCKNDSVTLTFTGTTSYSINSGADYVWLSSGVASFFPNQNKTYLVIGNDSIGCSDTLSISATVIDTIRTQLITTICIGDTLFGYYQSGVYSDTFSSTYGCDSIRILTLTVASAVRDTINLAICSNQAYHGYSAAGTYIDTFIGQGGCDSIRTLNLTISPTSQYSIFDTICNGESYLFGGNAIAVNGIYRDTLLNSFSCDSVITLHLTVLPLLYRTVNASICDGDVYYFNGQYLGVSGTYHDTLINTNGCDSIIILNLTVSPPNNTNVYQTICLGQSFEGYSNSGIFQDTLIGINGCDSVRVLYLTVSNLINTSESQIICFGDSYLGHSQSGTYSDTLSAFGGCDSIHTLLLTVLPENHFSLNKTICYGENFEGYTTNGSYLDTFVGTNGCDSIRTLTLEVLPLPLPTIMINGNLLSVIETFQSYQWYLDGNLIIGAVTDTLVAQANGTYLVVASDINGCSDTSLSVNMTGLSVSMSPSLGLNVYPNPTTGMLNIYCEGSPNARLILYNSLGQFLFEEKLNTNFHTMDIKKFPAGVYYLKIDNESSSITKKIVKH